MKITEDSLVTIIAKGKEEGYTQECTFDNHNKCMIMEGRAYKASELHLEGMRRFEGMSNPADAMIYYKIRATGGVKGYFAGAYGLLANAEAMNFITDIEETEV